MSKQERWKIRKRVQRMVKLDGRRCAICEKAHSLHRHHINEDITDNRLENIAVICKSCHIQIHSRVRPVVIGQWAAVTI